MSPGPYDALLMVSFGGPEGPDDVIPFLERVLAGRGVPRSRLEEVAGHYGHFDGVSPLNAQNRALIAALERELKAAGIELPVYFGNRNWHPLLEATLQEMRGAGICRALAFFTAAYSSYSGCRQYRENLAAARAAVGEGAPEVDRLRVFYNHPGFIEANADLLRRRLEGFGDPGEVTVLFTTHSLPVAMARRCDYERQLQETSSLVAAQAGISRWELVFQSRSGPPHQPWLEPDIVDRIHELAGDGVDLLAIAPIGFLSDHIEVLYDLDQEAAEACSGLGIEMARVPTVGTHPRFVRMIRELIEERLDPCRPRLALGKLGAGPDTCPDDCCLPG